MSVQVGKLVLNSGVHTYSIIAEMERDGVSVHCPHNNDCLHNRGGWGGELCAHVQPELVARIRHICQGSTAALHLAGINSSTEDNAMGVSPGLINLDTGQG